MRKVVLCPPWLRLCLAVAAIAGVSLGCGGSTSTGDASSSGLVGSWENAEPKQAGSGVEFTSQNGFSDYLFGQIVSYGEYQVKGDRLALHYLSPCGGENQLSCDVRLRFKVTGDTLVITDAYGDLVFTKVDHLW